MEIEKMNDFISTIRTDRLRQIEQYREKGYLIDKKFRLVDKIEVKHEEQLYCFGVQASGRDVYFYLIDDGENAYYSISEIYELLWKMTNTEGVSYVRAAGTWYSGIRNRCGSPWRTYDVGTFSGTAAFYQ